MKKMKTVLLLSAACAYFMAADVSLASLSDGVFLRGYASGAAKSTSVYTDTVLSHTHIRRVSSHTPFAAPAPLNLKTGTDDLFISTGAQGARSAFQAPISQQQTDGIDLPQVADRVKLRQLASVCFITDAGECSGGGARIDEPSSSSSGPGPIEPEPGKQCALEGYVNDVCPEGQQPGLACII